MTDHNARSGDAAEPAAESGSLDSATAGSVPSSEVRYPEFDAASLKRSLFWARPAAESIRLSLRLATRLSVTGGEKIGREPVILAPFHASALDPLVVAVAIWKEGVLPHFLAKSSLFGGFMGRALVTMGQIPVLRASTKAGDSLVHAKRALAAGQTVVIYPQGTLTKDPQLWPQQAKTGASRLAIETGAPVIPIAHWGLERVMPVGAKKFTPRPFSAVRVHFGDPLMPPSRDAERTSASLARGFADRVTAGIADDVAALRGVDLPQRFQDTIDSWDANHSAVTGERTDADTRAADDEETR